jgi:hypothetical protein
MIQNLTLVDRNCGAASFESIFKIVDRVVHERTVGNSSRNPIFMELSIQDGIGKEGFTLSKEGEDRYRVVGNDPLGLIYGIGRFLHEGHFIDSDFFPGDFIGSSVPEKRYRGMYIANPGWNYYGTITMEETEHYIEDLLLWGCNSIMVVIGGPGPEPEGVISSSSPPAGTQWCKDMLAFANGLGMTTVALAIANTSFVPPPEELKADGTGGHDGYFEQNLAAFGHTEICPSKPGGLEYILRGQKVAFMPYVSSPPDLICLWPYDTGGCTCTDCKPWGGNGYVRVAKGISELLREMFPKTSVMLSTWYFDHFTTGEWNLLAKELADDPSWVDSLMVHFNLEEGIPSIVQNNGRMPGGLPAVDFPEISMFNCVPWGGFGANPLPDRLQRMWDSSRQYLDGGFPYSEGIFDDINKILCLQLYWGGLRTNDILRKYSGYEFAEEVSENVSEAIRLIERATSHVRIDENGVQHIYPSPLVPWVGEQRFVIDDTSGIDLAYNLVKEADHRIGDRVRGSWRWRILYLRAVCDHELLHDDFKINERCEAALDELVRIYHAQSAPYHLSPPTKESIADARGIFII